MSKANRFGKSQKNAYGFEDLFVRERDDGDLDFLFAPADSAKKKAPKPVPKPKTLPLMANFDPSALRAKNIGQRDKFSEQGDGESLFVIIGNPKEGLIAKFETNAADNEAPCNQSFVAQRDGWRDLIGTIVFGLLGLWLRSQSR